jgi:hypothetical protein
MSVGTFQMLRVLRWKAHRDAIAEVSTVAIISVLPLLFGASVRWFQIENADLSWASYGHTVNGVLIHGELFLYALAFIAAIAWIALKEWPMGLRPPRIGLGIFCIVSICIITAFYSLDAAKVALHEDAVLIISAVILTTTLFLYYLAILLNKSGPPDLQAILAEESEGLSSQIGPGAAQ